ncbi:MAG: NTP transferase domain-containing protein [Phyllobacterium sp.]
MIFGKIPLSEAEGAVLAHSVSVGSGRLAKGHVLDVKDLAALVAAGATDVIAARLEPGDLGENEAAALLAGALAGEHMRVSDASTGRINFHAALDGLFLVDKTMIDRLNSVDPDITLACLADHVAVVRGEMVATIKIIPLAVAKPRVDAVIELLKSGEAFKLRPFVRHEVSLIATTLPSLKPSVMDKTARILDARLQAMGNALAREERVPHAADSVGDAIRTALKHRGTDSKLVIVFGASAVIDAADVIPEAIRLAGGEVIRVGMPVDPGNLLVLGTVGETVVIGAPGCARSPKENGFDWILSRVLAGEVPSAAAMAGMGVGGLLKEIQSRPRPRDARGGANMDIAIVLLAAGRGVRMGPDGPSKLLAEFEGVPLIRRSAETAVKSRVGPVVVVTGHRYQDMDAALSGLSVGISHNPDFETGMASSLIAGLSVPSARRSAGILIMLADMPGVTATDLARLADAFRRSNDSAIVRAVSKGKRGNPVILPMSLYPEIARLHGDVGARHIIENSGLTVVDIEIGDAAHLDVDTVEDVVAAGGVIKS